jgi:hypothetical protein
MRGNLNLYEASETYHPKILFKLPTALKEIDDDLIFVRMLKKMLHTKMCYDLLELLLCNFD